METHTAGRSICSNVCAMLGRRLVGQRFLDPAAKASHSFVLVPRRVHSFHCAYCFLLNRTHTTHFAMASFKLTLACVVALAGKRGTGRYTSRRCNPYGLKSVCLCAVHLPLHSRSLLIRPCSFRTRRLRDRADLGQGAFHLPCRARGKCLRDLPGRRCATRPRHSVRVTHTAHRSCRPLACPPPSTTPSSRARCSHPLVSGTGLTHDAHPLCQPATTGPHPLVAALADEAFANLLVALNITAEEALADVEGLYRVCHPHCPFCTAVYAPSDQVQRNSR